jgi:hypothetical protein
MRVKVLNLFNILLLVIAVMQYFLLVPLNSAGTSYISEIINFESSIKLIPVFIIPYFSTYIILLVLIISIIRLKQAWDLTLFLMAAIFLWSIVNFSHGFFPTQNTIRPEIQGTGFFFEAVRNLYANVKPYNTLPSWHAATAVLCAFAFFKMKFKGMVFIIFWCVLICLSPLFLKMAYIMDIIIAIPLGFISYVLAEKFTAGLMKTETIQEVVKTFTLESLMQSVVIGLRDENTIGSLADGLTRIEKNLNEKDKEEIKKSGSEMHPPVESLKEVINNLILSINVGRQLEKAREMFADGDKNYTLSDKELKLASDVLIHEASSPFDNQKFR